MLTVVTTSMPASSSSSMSCQRFSLREPAMLVWANSSTRTISGPLAKMASRSISSNVASRCTILRLGINSRFRNCAAVLTRPWVSR